MPSVDSEIGSRQTGERRSRGGDARTGLSHHDAKGMLKPMFATLTLNPAVDCTATVRGPLRINSIQSVVGEVRTPGGKGINVAKMIAANGKRVVAGGLVGEAEAGWFEPELENMGIVPRFLKVPMPTRANVMVTDCSGHELKLNRPGFPGLKPDWQALEKYCRGLVRGAGIVILSGSLPASFPVTTYARLVRLFRRMGRAVGLDTSGPPLVRALLEKPDVLKPNREELGQCFHKTITGPRVLLWALRKLLLHHEAVVVSDGARGAFFAAGGGILFARSPRVAVVDTTGAGDALLGQFCCDYFPRRVIDTAVAARAVAAGAAAVETSGTPALRLRRVMRLSAQAHVSGIV